MPATMKNPPKTSLAAEAHEAFIRLLVDASQPGFHGTAALTLALQDGHIQNIRVTMEKMIK